MKQLRSRQRRPQAATSLPGTMDYPGLMTLAQLYTWTEQAGREHEEH